MRTWNLIEVVSVFCEKKINRRSLYTRELHTQVGEHKFLVRI